MRPVAAPWPCEDSAKWYFLWAQPQVSVAQECWLCLVRRARRVDPTAMVRDLVLLEVCDPAPVSPVESLASLAGLAGEPAVIWAMEVLFTVGGPK